jgi:hypothetical protein
MAVCGDRGQRCRQHSDGGAQQEDAARHSEVRVSEPPTWRDIGSERQRLPGKSYCTPPRSRKRMPVDLDHMRQ